MEQLLLLLLLLKQLLKQVLLTVMSGTEVVVTAKYIIAQLWHQKILSTAPSKFLFVHLKTTSFFLQPKRIRNIIRYNW